MARSRFSFCLGSGCNRGHRSGPERLCRVCRRRGVQPDPERLRRNQRDLARSCEVVLHRKSSRMTPEECRKFEHATGFKVRDASDVKTIYARTGLRDAEKGEACYEQFDALKHHAETGQALDEKHTLAGMDLYGDYAKAKPFNFEQRWYENREKLRARGVDVSECRYEGSQ